MTPRDRVVNALKGRPVPLLPWIEHGGDPGVLARAFDLSLDLSVPAGGSPLERHMAKLELDKAVNDRTGRCNLEIPYHYTMAPRIRDPLTRAGLLTDERSLDQLRFVELTAGHWDELKRLVDLKGDYALSASISTGIGHIWQTMDLMAFAIACAENHRLLETILQRYTEWTCAVLREVQSMGIDFIWCFDDFAFKTGPVYSPEILRSVVLPFARTVAREIRLPWIFHSDGNLMSVLDELAGLGMDALNPIEHGCMDIERTQQIFPYLTLIGNVDVNLLAQGSPGQVRAFVRDMFRWMNHNDRYIPASGNSIPAFANPQNVRAMVEEIHACSLKAGEDGRDASRTPP